MPMDVLQWTQPPVNAPASSVTVAIIDSTDVTCNGGNDGEAEVGNANLVVPVHIPIYGIQVLPHKPSLV